MKTLYIDTHADFIQFVLFQDGVVKKEIKKQSETHHSFLVMPILNTFLKDAGVGVHDLSDILVVHGPGSFTGVRLGVTIAKTLAYTLHIPIRVISSVCIKAVSNQEKGFHWFGVQEKNGYFVGNFNDSDELLNDYLYIKNSDFEAFQRQHSVIVDVPLDFEAIYRYSRRIHPLNPHHVNPLYVKSIEVNR